MSALINGNTEKKKNIASINGKRLNYCSELGTRGYIRDTDTLKALISGEPMEARALYGNNFTAYDIPLYEQYEPVAEVHGLLQRYEETYHGTSVQDTDTDRKEGPEFATELSSEYAGISTGFVDGRDKFRMNGFRFTETQLVNGSTRKSLLLRVTSYT